MSSDKCRPFCFAHCVSSYNWSLLFHTQVAPHTLCFRTLCIKLQFVVTVSYPGCATYSLFSYIVYQVTIGRYYFIPRLRHILFVFVHCVSSYNWSLLFHTQVAPHTLCFRTLCIKLQLVVTVSYPGCATYSLFSYIVYQVTIGRYYFIPRLHHILFVFIHCVSSYNWSLLFHTQVAPHTLCFRTLCIKLQLVVTVSYPGCATYSLFSYIVYQVTIGRYYFIPRLHHILFVFIHCVSSYNWSLLFRTQVAPHTLCFHNCRYSCV